MPYYNITTFSVCQEKKIKKYRADASFADPLTFFGLFDNIKASKKPILWQTGKEDEMKRICSLALAVLLLCGVLAAAVHADGSPFSDVKEKRWSYEAIKYAYDNKLMDGVGDG